MVCCIFTFVVACPRDLVFNVGMNLPKLFKRANTGKVQDWTIFVEGNEYWTISGQTDGKKVTTKRTLCTGKNIGRSNETSDKEQALLEAKALWQKKKDKGYTEQINDVDSVVSHKVSPTLAKKYEDHFHKYSFPVYADPKFDGLRCIITREGAFSREWKPFMTLQYLQDLLKPVFDKHPNIIAFDGEVYNHLYKEDFNSICSLVKRTKPSQEDIDRAKDKIQYHIYDYVDKNLNISFADRLKNRIQYVNEADSSSVVCVESKLFDTQEELDLHFEKCLEFGYEGQMIRDPKSIYEHKRTDKLLKRKVFQDEEYEIIGYEEGKGNRAGCIILVCKTPEGLTFTSCVNGSVEYQRRLFNNVEKLIGLNATIKFQNKTPDGLPRFLKCIKIRGKNGEDLAF